MPTRKKPTQFNVFEAGKLIASAYSGALGRKRGVISVNVAGAQAHFIEATNTLVIPGTNERSDWTNFNLQTSAKKGDSGRFYHGGFLDHAQMIYMFAKPLKPACVVGHSLGAASAQIVGASLKVPTLAFASPKVLSGKATLAGEGWVANYLRQDDMVCHVPPGIGRKKYRHIGSRYWMAPAGINVGEDHTVANYLSLLRDKRYKTLIPKDWPKS